MCRWSVLSFCLCVHVCVHRGVLMCVCTHSCGCAVFLCTRAGVCVHGRVHVCTMHKVLACMCHAHMCVHACFTYSVRTPVPTLHTTSCSKLEDSVYFSLLFAFSP